MPNSDEWANIPQSFVHNTMKLVSAVVQGLGFVHNLRKTPTNHRARSCASLLRRDNPAFTRSMSVAVTADVLEDDIGLRTPTNATATLETRQSLISNILPPLPTGSRRVYLLRHGETDWNKMGKIQGGGYDIPLNANGKSQALSAALALEDIPLTVVASSHLSRAKETADILWSRHQTNVGDRRIISDGFGEMRFGDFEGLAWRDASSDRHMVARFQKYSAATKADPNVAFPGDGECNRDVQVRSMQALQKLLAEHPDESHIAVVGHGRTNRLLIAATPFENEMDRVDVKQGNTCINVMDVDKQGRWTLQVVNYIEHVRDKVIIR